MRFMTRRRLFLIILIPVVAAASAYLAYRSYRFSAAVTARDALNAEIAQLKADTDRVIEDNGTLQSDIERLDAELAEKDSANSEYVELKKTRDSLQTEIEELKTRSADLDNSIAEKRENAANPQADTANLKTGARYALKQGETYSCPDKIPAGRYKAVGSGLFIVINSSLMTRVSVNLDTSFENSYTFDLKEKEKVQTAGDVILTEILSE